LLTVRKLEKIIISFAWSAEASVRGDILVAGPIVDDLWGNNEFLDLS